MSRDMLPRLRAYIIVMVLLLPMFFAGVKDSHDWGDDFISYIEGAQNLIHHRPIHESKYISFENYNYRYSPPNVPAGFPVLLTPVVKFFGVNFKVFNYYMSFWMYLLAIACFAFLSRYLSLLSAACLTLIVFLNPWVLMLKYEVISDLPFSVFFTLSLLLYLRIAETNKLVYQILFGITVAMLLSLRSIGACIFICIGIDLSRLFITHLMDSGSVKGAFRLALSRMYWAIPFVVVYAALSAITGHSGGSTFAFYKATFMGIHVWELMMANLNIYITNFLQYFDHDAGIYAFGIAITKAAMLFCFVIGFIASLTRGYSIVMVYFFIYTLVILLYPINNQGFRYFFPLWPVILLYIGYGARSISVPLLTSRYAVLLVTLLILMQYRSDLWYMYIHRADPIYPTPVSVECRSGFSRIRDLTSDSDLILSLKPKACSFFSDRRFCVEPDATGPEAQSRKLAISKPGYILVIKQIDYNQMESLAQYERDSAVYEDNMFKLYKRKI